MNILKGIGVGILSFILFISLSVFGIAFMLNQTLLNPDFVTDEVDKIDISTITKEIIEEQISGQQPEEVSFLLESVYDVIDDQEPLVKEQIKTAIYSSYDYLLGKSETLNVVISLMPLKESLRGSLWQTFQEKLPIFLPNLLEKELSPYLDQHYDEFIEQIPEEYLPPEVAELPKEQLKPYIEQYFQETLGQMTYEELPPEFSILLEDLLRPYYDQYYDELVRQIPSEFIINESEIPPEVMAQLIIARQYIVYFQTGYYVLIGLMVLLVLSIILIHRNVRDTTRALGMDFLIYGLLEFTGVYLARNFAPMGLTPLDILSSFQIQIPPSLQVWITGLYSDLLAPLQFFSLGILIAGIILIVVSFVYRPRPAKD